MSKDKKYIIAFTICILQLPIFCEADVDAQKIEYANTIIETGKSTESIMPFLTHTAGFAGKYFSRMYGQNRNGYIIIYFNRNSRHITLEGMENLVKGIVRNINTFHPSSVGELEIIASDVDIWDSLNVEFENGIITNKRILPNDHILIKRKKLQNRHS